MRGDLGLFGRQDAIEAQWAVVDPVLDFIKAQQPNVAFTDLQRRLIDKQRAIF